MKTYSLQFKNEISIHQTHYTTIMFFLYSCRNAMSLLSTSITMQVWFIIVIMSLFLIFAFAQFGAFPVGFLAWTSPSATCSTFAGTPHKFTYSLCCRRQRAPDRNPGLCFCIQCPTTAFSSWCLLLGLVTGCPNASLVHCTLDVLQQGLLSWRKVLHRSVFLAKQFLSCFASFTDTRVLVLSYITTVKRSSIWNSWQSSVICACGCSKMKLKASVTSV